MRSAKVKLPRSYLERAARAEAFGTFDAVATTQLPFEFMLNALRLNEGVTIDAFERGTGLCAKRHRQARSRCARARAGSKRTTARLRPTETGRRFLNDLIALFLPE